MTAEKYWAFLEYLIKQCSSVMELKSIELDHMQQLSEEVTKMKNLVALSDFDGQVKSLVQNVDFSFEELTFKRSLLSKITNVAMIGVFAFKNSSLNRSKCVEEVQLLKDQLTKLRFT